MFALSQVQGDAVASKKVARPDESLHASRLNIVTTKRLARSLVHHLLILLCLIIAAQVVKPCVIKANADGSRVSKMCLIVIDTFSDIGKRRAVVANKKIFEILIFDDGLPRVKLLYCPAARAVREEEFASAQTVSYYCMTMFFLQSTLIVRSDVH